MRHSIINNTSTVMYNHSCTLRISKKTLAMLVVSLVYASFVVFFPWHKISKQEKLTDFNRYVEYYNMQEQSKIEMYGINSILGYLTGEILWDEIIRLITTKTGDAAITLRLVSFFICMVWGIFLFSRIPPGWALLFLLNPISIDIAMSQIRNGLAWSFIIIGIMTSSRIVKGIMYFSAPFFHITSLGLIALNLINNIFVKRIRAKVAVIIFLIISGLVLGFSLTVGNEVILGALGDRRGGVDYIRGGGSVLQMVFWVILLLAQLSSGKKYLRRNALVVSLLVWYLVMNPFIPWSYRLWGAFIPVIAVSIWEIPKIKRKYILSIWLGYLMFWYLYWTKLFDYWYPV